MYDVIKGGEEKGFVSGEEIIHSLIRCLQTCAVM